MILSQASFNHWQRQHRICICELDFCYACNGWSVLLTCAMTKIDAVAADGLVSKCIRPLIGAAYNLYFMLAISMLIIFYLRLTQAMFLAYDQGCVCWWSAAKCIQPLADTAYNLWLYIKILLCVCRIINAFKAMRVLLNQCFVCAPTIGYMINAVFADGLVPRCIQPLVDSA